MTTPPIIVISSFVFLMLINLSLIRIFFSGQTRAVCSQGSYGGPCVDRSLEFAIDYYLFDARSFLSNVLDLEFAEESFRIRISDVC